MSEDFTILHKAKEALSKNEAMRELSLHLRVVGGVVFLDGEVKTAEESEAVEALLREVEGVKWVQNRLQVNPEEIPDERGPHGHKA